MHGRTAKSASTDLSMSSIRPGRGGRDRVPSGSWGPAAAVAPEAGKLGLAGVPKPTGDHTYARALRAHTHGVIVTFASIVSSG